MEKIDNMFLMEFLGRIQLKHCSVYLNSGIKIDGNLLDHDDVCLVISGRSGPVMLMLHSVASVVPGDYFEWDPDGVADDQVEF